MSIGISTASFYPLEVEEAVKIISENRIECAEIFYNSSREIKDSFTDYILDIIKEKLDKKNIKLFNEYNYGSYLLYRGIPVFIDSRADLYTKQFSGFDYDIFDDYFYITNKKGLLSEVQMNSIEFHVWGSNVKKLEYPINIKKPNPKYAQIIISQYGGA